jgi:hypothetical protein
MKLEECLGAYREGKTIVSHDGMEYHNFEKHGCELISGASEKELLGEWTIEEEPKPTVKMWPALLQQCSGSWVISSMLFISEEEAKHKTIISAYKKVIWPAIPGQDGAFEVPQE